MKKNQKGFGPIELLILLLVVAVICVGGWYAWRHNHDDAKTKAAATNTQDPYSGWKSYCNTITSDCFKYPSDWKLNGSPNDLHEAFLSNQIDSAIRQRPETVSIEYHNPSGCAEACQQETFYTVQVVPLSGTYSNLTVLGGMITDANNVPMYMLVDSAYVKDHSVTAGKAFTFTEGTGYTQKSGKAQSSLEALDTEVTTLPVPQQKALDWFSTTDAKTSLMIMKSFFRN